MNINDLTLGEAKQLASLFEPSKESASNGDCEFYEVGKSFMVMTIAHYIVGELVGFNDRELFFKKASVVVDTGRFMNCAKNGELDEVEPYPDNMKVKVSRDAIVRAHPWMFALPLSQK